MPVIDQTADALAGAPPTPTQDSSQPVPQQAQPAQAAAPAQPAAPAVPAHVLQDNVIGKGVKALARLVHGQETNYQVNPQTGATEETTAPAKPGAVFRNILLGALVGGAVGGEGHGGFLGGVARGGAASAAQAQQQDAQRRQQSQQTFQNQMSARKEQSEESSAEQLRLYHAALTAHTNLQMVGTQQQMYRQNQEAVEKHNEAARAYEKSLVDSGGLKATLTIDGTPHDTVSAADLMTTYTKDPTIARAADGFQRHFINTADISELHFDGHHWTEDDGSPASMDDKTSIVAIDTPQNTFKTPRSVPGKELNTIRGAKIADPDKTYLVAPDALSGLYGLNMKEQAERARADHEKELANKTKTGTPSQFAQVEARKATALSRAEKQFDKDGDVDALNKAKAEAQQAYAAEVVSLGGSVSQAQPQNSPQSQPKTFSPTKWKAANPNGDVNAAIAEAKKQKLQIIQ